MSIVDLTPNDLVAIRHLIDEEEYDAAGNLVNAYLTKFPDDEMAVYLLARLCLETNKPAIAWQLLRSRTDSPNWTVLYTAARALSMLHRQDEAIELYEKALEYEAHPAIMHGISCAYVELREPAKAIDWAQKTLALEPEHALALANIGYAHLQMRDYGPGWEGYDHGVGNLISRQERCYHGEPAWDGRKGARLAVYSDQGLGDQIAGIEPLRDVLKDCEVACLDVDPKLRNLFARNFPEIPVHGPDAPDDIDYHCALFSMHRYYRPDEAAYNKQPYLAPHPEMVIMWRALLDSLSTLPKIGVAWSGGVPATHAFERRATLDSLLPVLRLPAEFISLEYLDREDEIADFDQRKGIYLHDWPKVTRSHEGQDMEDLAALVSQLDAVVSVPTTATHLAGALGVPTYCMVNRRPNIHYANNGGTMPYYGSVRLYRGERVDVVQEIASALSAALRERTAA